jgi:hypothetical protein
MKSVTMGMLACLSIPVTSTAALAGGYEIFAPTYTSALEGQQWAVERFDYKNRQFHHCHALFETKTKELTGQCTEKPDFPQKPAVDGPDLQRAMSNYVGGLPLGFWHIDRATGKTEFCTLGAAQCVDVTPK